MDNKKFEQLIDLIINENEEQAKALFHDIVVEKSREIYESMMDEEQMMNQPSGQVQDLLDEIGSEEEGMAEAEDEEFDIADMDDDGEETVDIDMDDEEGGEEGLEDRVVDLEDKLDQLMAEFEDIMGGDDMGDDDMGDDDMGDMGDDDMGDDDMGGEEDPMMEAITLKKIAVTHGDNGVQTKSTNLNNSGQAEWTASLLSSVVNLNQFQQDQKAQVMHMQKVKHQLKVQDHLRMLQHKTMQT